MAKFQFDSAREAEAARAFLVTVALGRRRWSDAAEELTELVTSDGLAVVGLMQARRDKPDPATCLGSGKIEEIAGLAKAARADVVVFDAALSAAQERNISRACELPVMDRTELILEIFRKRAKSKEGRLQVELARLEHLSTRLVRGWTHLERQRGGLGKTGGPGEKQIELDRRMIGTRVKQLRDQLKKLSRQRDLQRKSRLKSDAVTVSLVGYTNAGKSTLFNALVREKTYAADQLFATLDTTARRCWVSDTDTVVLSDTVGFIRDLPHQLVEAFKSTLDETVHADVLLHVVDSACAVRDEQIQAVQAVLQQIKADEIPTIVVLNKIDVSGLDAAVMRNPDGSIKSVALSAATGDGLELLRSALVETARAVREAKASVSRPLEYWEEDAGDEPDGAGATDPAVMDQAADRAP